MRALMRLTPATSTIDGSITTSLVSTYPLVSPDATVLTITLGTPTGKARIAAVPTAVPALPPIPRIPSIRPSSKSRRTTAAPPWAITPMAVPRSPWDRRSARLVPPASAT